MVYWLCAAAALIGVLFNIRHHPACFWIWLCTNAVWAYSCFDHGMTAQACLHLSYVGLSVYGIRQWSRGCWGPHPLRRRRIPPRMTEPSAS